MRTLDDTYWPLAVPGITDSRGGCLEVTAPYDGSFIARVECVHTAALEYALDTVDRLHRDRDLWIPKPRRIEILRRAAGIMRENAEVLALESAREGGKPLADSRVEVERAINCLEICVETLQTDAGHVVPMNLSAASSNRLAFTQGEPIGPVVAISAFNHPLNLITHQVAPAVAVGCPVIVKPAQSTPLSCLRFIEILRAAGLPEEWAIPVVTADTALAERLATDSRTGFFSFIGSSKVGWMLRSKLAPGVRCALEHGGVAPVIVAEDADLDIAVPRLAKGGFYHAGQVCVSVQRVYAPRAMAAELAERLAEAGRALKVGDPTNIDTEVGPLISSSEADRVELWVSEAVEGGARLVAGGVRISPSCYSPTVLLDPPADARVSTGEVFGPVICIYSYDKQDSAIDHANALGVAFQAAVFTRDIDTAMRCFRRLNGSAVILNDHTAFRVDWMPFAGLRESGHGVGGIPHTMHEMQNHKMLVMHSGEL